MSKISSWFTNVVEWIDCFDVRVLRWYLKLKTLFKVLMFVPIVIYMFISTVVSTILVLFYDIVGLVVCSVLGIGEHIRRAKIMNQYEEQKLKIKQEIEDSES